jgi:hypothetical protein
MLECYLNPRVESDAWDGRTHTEQGACMDTIKDCERELRALFDGHYGWHIRDLLLGGKRPGPYLGST